MSTEITTTIPAGDGWGDADTDARIIQGTLARCVDGHWSDKAGTGLPKRVLALSTVTAVQCWRDQKPVETIVEQPLPDVDALNAKIPQDTWEVGLDGKPRPPWQRQWIVYFIDPDTAAKYTFANGTTGARIAVGDLKDAVKCMRAMRGGNVVPLVELASAPMKTKFGQKLRPHFKIVSWVAPGGGMPVVESKSIVPQLEHKPSVPGRSPLKVVPPPMIDEELNDEVPF